MWPSWGLKRNAGAPTTATTVSIRLSRAAVFGCARPSGSWMNWKRCTYLRHQAGAFHRPGREPAGRAPAVHLPEDPRTPTGDRLDRFLSRRHAYRRRHGALPESGPCDLVLFSRRGLGPCTATAREGPHPGSDPRCGASCGGKRRSHRLPLSCQFARRDPPHRRRNPPASRRALRDPCFRSANLGAVVINTVRLYPGAPLTEYF